MGDLRSTAARVEEIRQEILSLQREIRIREDEISGLVDLVERPSILSERMRDGDDKKRLEHLERLVSSWDTLVARGRAVSENDSDMVLALARCIGDLLLTQPEALDKRWVTKLREYLLEQQSQIS